MGKKVKKRITRNTQKDNRLSTASPKNTSHKIIPINITDGASIIKETTICPHLGTSINLEKVSSKITSLESLKCDDCREVVSDRRARGKNGKKKVGSSKSDSKSIWVCLECGQFTCGGIGLPTTPQTHAIRHAKKNNHPLAIKLANPNLRFCFLCNTIIPKISENNEEQKDVFSDVVKVLKARSKSEPSLDVEDVWFGNGSNDVNTPSILENSGGYKVKGLTNLGNTCFFNSILQNLLAMEKLRDYFLKLEGPVGPLSDSLKKLYVETNPLTFAKDVITPRPLFNSICSIANQFKGFQQQDSHELLRFLLDGLSNEESNVQNLNLKDSLTFVDSIFGGQLSSKVSCLECGYTSIVYEPYLDLSLPLPARKSLSKKIPLISKSKKQKPPPKRRGKNSTKINKDSDTLPAGTSDSSHVEKNNVIEKFSEITIEESKLDTDNDNNNMKVDSSDVSWLDYLDANDDNNNYNNIIKVDSSDFSSWLDYLGPNDEIAPEAIQIEDSWLDYLDPCSLSNDNDILSQNGNELFREEEETLLKVEESEVILLPYEEIIITNNGNEQSDFDGFGGLFDEPEVTVGPTTVKIESESDSDEVDNSDSPVSVDKCLEFFTNSEILTKSEHAWQCEQCTKAALLEQKLKLKKKLLNGVENGVINIQSNGFKNPCCDESSELEEKGCLVNGCNEESCTVQVEDDESCKNEKSPKRVSNRLLAKRTGGNGVVDNDDVEFGDFKVIRDASKRILINKVPPILTIHLKRLSQDARGRLSKLNGHVDFKEIIDLAPYMDPSSCEARGTYKYQLIGVVEHIGTMRGGHYVAYIRVKGSNGNYLWYHASDAHVQQVSLEEVLRCEAYILFYEQM